MLALLLLVPLFLLASDSSTTEPRAAGAAALGFTPREKGFGPPSIGIWIIVAEPDFTSPLGYRAQTQDEVATSFDMSVAELRALNPKATLPTEWRVGIPVRVYVWPDAGLL